METKAINLTVGVPDEVDSDIPELFQSLGEGSTIKGTTRWLTSKEYELAHLYVLSNIEILREYEEWVLSNIENLIIQVFKSYANMFN